MEPFPAARAEARARRVVRVAWYRLPGERRKSTIIIVIHPDNYTAAATYFLRESEYRQRLIVQRARAAPRYGHERCSIGAKIASGPALAHARAPARFMAGSHAPARPRRASEGGRQARQEKCQDREAGNGK